MGEKFAQCCFKKCNWTYVAWIPIKLALLNSIVKLKFNGIWEDGWTIVNVGAIEDRSTVNHMSQSHKKHRLSSDI